MEDADFSLSHTLPYNTCSELPDKLKFDIEIIP